MLIFETHWSKPKDLEEKRKHSHRVHPLFKVDFPTKALLYPWKPQFLSKSLRTDQDTAKPKIPTSGPSREWGWMQMANLSLFCSLSRRMPAFFTPFPADCLVNVATATSSVLSLTPDLGNVRPFPAEEPPLGSLTCYYFMLNRPDLCNIFYQATVLSLNSLFWMNTDFVTWSQLYNEMQTRKRLNQFTKNLFVKHCGDVPNFVWVVHAALDKGVKM